MAALEYLTQNSLTAYPFKRSQPAGADTNNPIQDNWFYDILFISFSSSIRSVYISYLEKTESGNINITFSNTETLGEIGESFTIPSELVEDHLQNKLNSFVSYSSALFAVKIVLGAGLVTKEPFSQTYSASEAQLVNAAVIPSSPKLLSLIFKAYASEILPGGQVQTSVNEIKSFSFESSEPLIKLKHNLAFQLESTSQGGLYVDAGLGTGLYDNCPTADEISEVYTLNNISPNDVGSFFLNHSACHTLNTLSDNDKTYLTSTHQLDNYADEFIVPGHSLILQNFCKSKCPRENINAFAHYLNRVTDGAAELNEIAFNSVETRGKGTPVVDVFNVSEFCVESTEQAPDPFKRCSEHTEPVDTYIACSGGFRKYFHEFRTIQLFYDNLTIRNYTIIEVIDENSVRLDTPPTAGNALWFRVRDNGVISNMNCAAVAYNLLSDSNTRPYFKVKYTTGESYDSDGNYITLLAVSVALFNPSIKADTSLEVSFTPTVLTQQGYFKIRKATSVENSLTATTILGCKEYAFIEVIYRIPCGITGGGLDIDVFDTSDGGTVQIGSTYTIENIDGALCPGDVVTQSKSFRITKSGWTAFNSPAYKNYLNIGLGIIATQMLGDVPFGGWLVYDTSYSSEYLYLTAGYEPPITTSKRYSIIFKNISLANTTTYARCVIDYVAPPTIASPLASTYTSESPLIFSKDVTYTSESPAFKINASNMIILSDEFATDLTDFYYTAEGLPEGLELDSSTGAVIGTIATSVETGDFLITIDAHNASGYSTNSQQLSCRIPAQAKPELSFDPTTPGPAFNITNFTTYTTEASIYKLVATNTPIYLYTLYFTGGTTQLPEGLYFNTATGTITGRVTALSTGTGYFEITATNAYGESLDRLAFTLNYTVYSKPNITYPQQYAIIGTTVDSSTTLESPLFTIEATQAFGGTDNFAEGLTNTTRNKYTAPAWNNVTGIPPGFYLDLYTGKFYGELSSSELPTDPLITSYVLNYPITLTATNPIGVNITYITVKISSVGVPVIDSVSPKTVIRNTTYTEEAPLFTITASNNPTSFSATGLPTGLTCSSLTGNIVGTVNSSLIAGNYTVTLNASNDKGAATPLGCTLKLLISITDVSPAAPYNLLTGTYYSNIFTVSTSGVKPTDTVSLTMTSPPAGLSFTNGVLSGTPTSRGAFTLRATASTQNFGSTFQDIAVSIASPTYTIEGTILDDLDAPVSGALITVSTGITGTSGVDGKYTIANVPAGIYNVKATKTSCIATPTSQRITIPPPVPTTQPDLDKVDFTVIGPLRTIRGTLLVTGTEAPLSSLSVSDGYRTVTSNSFGVFEISSSYNEVTLSVTSTQYYFAPTVIPAGSLSVDGVVIYGLPIYTLLGAIIAADNIVGNITVEATNTSTLEKTSVVATKSGNTASYSLTLRQAEYSVAVIGSAGIYKFSTSPITTTISSNRIIDFTADIAFSISGKVNVLAPSIGDTDIPIAGVELTIGGSTVTSGNDGSYTFNNFTAGTYEITASKEGLVFPTTQTVTITNSNAVNVDFHPNAYNVAGAVYYTDPAVKISGITLKIRDKVTSTLYRTVTSTAAGYTITNLPKGVYVISAEQVGCTIQLKDSVDYDVTISSANITNKDFTITAVSPVNPEEAQINSVTVDNDNTLIVAFSPSVITTGSPILKYEYSTDDGVTWSAITDYISNYSFRISTGIELGTTYIVKIRVTNLYGNAVSDGYSITTPSTPAAPTIDSVTTKSGGRGLNIYFTAGSDNGAPITKYEWKAAPHESEEWTSWTDTDPSNDVTSPVTTSGDYFINGDKYDIQLRAKNRIGYSDPSEILYNVGPASAPDSPYNASYATPLATNSGELSIQYEIINDGGSAITDIEYRVTPEGGTTSNFVSTGETSYNASIAVSGLINGKIYTIEIRAVNSLGKSPWRAYTPAKPGTNPAAPNITAISAKDSSAVISFTEVPSTPVENPPNGGYLIVAYYFYFYIGEPVGDPVFTYTYPRTVWEAQNKPASPYIAAGLTNTQTYTVTAKAENDLGLFSNFSAPVEITPQRSEPIGAPEITNVSYTFDDTYQTGAVLLTMADFSISQAGVKDVSAYFCEIVPVNPEESTVTIPVTTTAPVYSEEINAYLSETDRIIVQDIPPSNAYPFIPGADYSLTTKVITDLGTGTATDAKQLRYLSPGYLPSGSISLRPGVLGTEVKLVYTLAEGESVDGSTTVDYLLARIGADSANAGFSSVEYSLDNVTYNTASIAIPYPTLINTIDWPGELTLTENWPGEITLTENWPGALTLTVGWIGELIGYDEYGNPNYDRGNPTIENGGYYYDVYATPTIANGGYYYNTEATPTPENGGYYYNTEATRSLENGGVYANYEKNYIHFYIQPPEEGYPFDIYLRAVNNYGTSLEYLKLTATASAPSGLVLSGTPLVSYKNFRFNYTLDDQDDIIEDGFGIQYSLNNTTFYNVDSFNSNYLTPPASALVTLDNGSYPTLYARAVNWFGVGPSAQFSQPIVIGAPGAPTLTVTNPAARQLSFTVTKPLDNGGSAITSYSYRVDFNSTTGTTYTHAPADSFIVTEAFGSNLLNAGNYTLYVKAINSRGTGQEASITGVPGFTPGLPTQHFPTQGDKKVTIQWKSGSTGNAAQGGFIFNNQDLGNDYTYTAAGQTFAKDILGAAGSAYSYSIRQYNQYGTSDAVSATGVIAYSSSAPTLTGFTALSGSAGNIGIVLPAGANAWAPSGNGALNIYEYSMTKGPGVIPDPFLTSSLSRFTPYTINGLEPGSVYNIMIRAAFFNGVRSEFSNILTISTPATPDPSEITYLGAYPDFLLLQINNSRATSMLYDIEHLNGTSSGTIYDFLYTGYLALCPNNTASLNLGTAQFMTLTTHASNISSSEDQNDSLNFYYDPGVVQTRKLLPPRLLSVENIFGGVIFTFQLPKCQPLVTGISYIAVLESGTRITLTSVATPDLEGITTGRIALAPGTYNNVYLISRTTALGDSLFISNLLQVKPFGAPSAPSNFTATPGNNSILVTFDVPVTNNLPIAGYGYRTGTGALRTFSSTTTTGSTVSGTITIASDNTSITNGTNYVVYVYAYSTLNSVVYNGALSVSRSVKPSTVPSKIQLSSINATTSDKRISINIAPLPSDGGNTITRYGYSLDNGTNYTLTNTAALPIVVTSWQGATLVNGNNYNLKLKAVNAAGESIDSETLVVRPSTTPNQPTSLIAVNRDRSVVVKFNPPSSNGGEAITNYEYSTNDGITFKPLSPASGLPTVPGITGIALEITTVSNGSSILVNGEPYVIKLKAVNLRGAGTISSYVVGIPTAG